MKRFLRLGFQIREFQIREKINLYKVKIFSMLLLLLLLTTKSFGCVGARPLAMGGAFVAVADDLNALYWNPAGLAQLEAGESTWMHTINNRKGMNYQDFLGFALKPKKDMSTGISYIHLRFFREYYGGKLIYDRNIRLYGFSLAKKLEKNISLGVTVRQHEEELTEKKFLGKEVSADGSAIAADLGIHYKIDENLSFGVLVQNFNEPEVKLKYGGKIVDKQNWIRNIRPGFAYKPNKNITFACDIYYFTLDNVYDEDVKEQSDVRVGVEFLPNENWALRAGYYGDAFNTIGFGYRKDNFQIDYALLSSEGKLGVHFVSTSWKFR